jgi:hypothetical protein
MKKQTAVEFLVDKWVRQGTLYSSDCKQALELEKQQIIDAQLNGQREEVKFIKEAKEEAEIYYQETFKSEKNKGCACYGNNAVHKCNCK